MATIKKVIVEFLVEETAMEEMVERALNDCSSEEQNDLITETRAFREEIQWRLYEWTVNGSIMIQSVETVDM